MSASANLNIRTLCTHIKHNACFLYDDHIAYESYTVEILQEGIHASSLRAVCTGPQSVRPMFASRSYHYVKNNAKSIDRATIRALREMEAISAKWKDRKVRQHIKKRPERPKLIVILKLKGISSSRFRRLAELDAEEKGKGLKGEEVGVTDRVYVHFD